MKRLSRIVLTVILGVLVANHAIADVPNLLPIQGVLTDSEGNFIDGATEAVFSVYDVAIGGKPLYTEPYLGDDAVFVEAGFFTVYLGELVALNTNALIAASELWLGVTVGADSEMERIPIASVLFALHAKSCEMVGSLTETDINDNFLSSSYAPKWSDVTEVPAGFADAVDDGFTSEGDLTSLLNDNYSAMGHDHDSNYSAAGHNHDSNYAASGHNHDSDYAASVHDHDGRYYTEAEVQTSGSASIHWNNLTSVPAGFADGVDNGYTTEGQLTLLLNDNYAASGHNHDSAYSQLSHIHDGRYYTETELQTSGSANVHWNNLSSVPAGFSDGVDNGFTTEGHLTALLNDNYAAASHTHSLVLVGGGHGWSPAVSSSGTYYFPSAANFTATFTGKCAVTITARTSESSAGASTFNVRTARKQDGSNTNDFSDTHYGVQSVNPNWYVGTVTDGTWSITAGRDYEFGCYIDGDGNFASNTFWCRVSYTCAAN